MESRLTDFENKHVLVSTKKINKVLGTALSNNEIEWVNETISNSLSASFVYEECDRQLDLWTRFKASDYRSISGIVQEIEQATIDLNNKFRRAKVVQSTDQMFSLKPENMSYVIADTL